MKFVYFLAMDNDQSIIKGKERPARRNYIVGDRRNIETFQKTEVLIIMKEFNIFNNKNISLTYLKKSTSLVNRSVSFRMKHKIFDKKRTTFLNFLDRFHIIKCF